jgi:hypothetical protein
VRGAAITESVRPGLVIRDRTLQSLEDQA